ncbi:MAG: DUF2199 domain-containing protein [Pyrinomonadaceae bacterium]|nr:DUF2199 domain-containing protein [Pyrinomonadaceae bacterium]
MFEFKCNTCDKIHQGVPTFGYEFPIYYLDVPENERSERCFLTSDTCVIDDKFFFVRGCVEIHVHGEEEPFIWGVWVSLSEKSFFRFQELYEVAERDEEPPFFGWLNTCFADYSTEEENLKTNVYLRNNGIRPYIDIEPTNHRLAVEQREGISKERLIEIYELMTHGKRKEL